MHRFLVRLSESEASNDRPSLADFTTTTPELRFSVHTTSHFSEKKSNVRRQLLRQRKEIRDLERCGHPNQVGRRAADPDAVKGR
jgi:hypothetical protein